MQPDMPKSFEHIINSKLYLELNESQLMNLFLGANTYADINSYSLLNVIYFYRIACRLLQVNEFHVLHIFK